MEYAIAGILLLVVLAIVGAFVAGSKAGKNKAHKNFLLGTEEARERHDEAKEDFNAAGGLAGAALGGVQDSGGDSSKV